MAPPAWTLYLFARVEIGKKVELWEAGEAGCGGTVAMRGAGWCNRFPHLPQVFVYERGRREVRAGASRTEAITRQRSPCDPHSGKALRASSASLRPFGCAGGPQGLCEGL